MLRRLAFMIAIIALAAGTAATVSTAAYAGGVSGGVLRNGK
jgi:hypothetical protein